jgi:hypothetical protein
MNSPSSFCLLVIILELEIYVASRLPRTHTDTLDSRLEIVFQRYDTDDEAIIKELAFGRYSESQSQRDTYVHNGLSSTEPM